MWMRVEHSDTSVLLNFRAFHQKGGEENQVFIYAKKIADNHNTVHGAPMKSAVDWNGDALEVPLPYDAWQERAQGGRTLDALNRRSNSSYSEKSQDVKDWPPDTCSAQVGYSRAEY